MVESARHRRRAHVALIEYPVRPIIADRICRAERRNRMLSRQEWRRSKRSRLIYTGPRIRGIPESKAQEIASMKKRIVLRYAEVLLAGLLAQNPVNAQA